MQRKEQLKINKEGIFCVLEKWERKWSYGVVVLEENQWDALKDLTRLECLDDSTGGFSVTTGNS